MTENALATTVRPGATAIVTVAEMAQKLRYMIQNGSKLADQEVMAFAQYSVATDLNPFAGECYYLPGKGPCPGIAGWRKKAQEQLDWEAAQAHEAGAHFWVEYEVASQDEAKYDPGKGDVAWKCIVRDWLSSKRWRTAYFQTARDLRDMGVPNPLEEAKHYCGPEPVWTGVAVVFGTENFGGDKMDRNERAKKRAEKIALRKRFPRIHLSEPEGVDVDMVEGYVTEVQPTTPTRTEEQLIGEIMGDSEQPKSSPMTQAALDLGGELKYEGQVAVIGKHKYPVAWAKALAGFKRANEYEVDGILQQLALPGDTPIENVVAEIELHLQEKGK